MDHGEKETRAELTIRDLYPHFEDAQLEEAEENLTRYLELALRIYERIQAEAQGEPRIGALTAPGEKPTIKSDRPARKLP